MAEPAAVSTGTLDAKSATNPPSSFYSVGSRIPVFGSLSRLARRSTFQENDKSRQNIRGVALSRHGSDTSRQVSSCPASGSSTPRSDSPEALELTRIDHSIPHQNTDRIKSDAAEMAIRLWIMARDPARWLDTQSQAQARTMQIDAVRYMHMSLPSDLTPAEIAAIRASLPLELRSDGLLSRNVKPTALRRTVAQVVTLLMALIIFFIPLLTSLLNRVMKYEREHRMTERVLVRTQNTVRGLSDYRVQAQYTLIRFLESPAGRRVVKSGVYVVEGIAGGVVDGYSGYVGANSLGGGGPPPTGRPMTLRAP